MKALADFADSKNAMTGIFYGKLSRFESILKMGTRLAFISSDIILSGSLRGRNKSFGESVVIRLHTLKSALNIRALDGRERNPCIN